MKVFLNSLCSVFLAAMLLLSFAARAEDPSLETAQECTRHLPTMERLYNIPAHWLAAIASTESGRYHQRLRLSVPWPWTINVAGKGYWFDTKQEAVNAVRRYQAQGIKSIDVGCMQVNLMYHGKNFASLEQAFEPIYNISYAAKFLKQKYNDQGSWTKATAAYHSMSSRGAGYYKKVYEKWQQVVDRLNDQMFAASIPSTVRDALPERPDSFAFRDQNPGFKPRDTAPLVPFKIARPPETPLQPQQRVRMNDIKVTRGFGTEQIASNAGTESLQTAPRPRASMSFQPTATGGDKPIQTPSGVQLTPLQLNPQFRPPAPRVVAPSQPPVQLRASTNSSSQFDPSIFYEVEKKVESRDKKESTAIPKSRMYERGVLVIRPNQQAEEETQEDSSEDAGAAESSEDILGRDQDVVRQFEPSRYVEREPAKARLADNPTTGTDNRGQFNPSALDVAADPSGGYVSDRAKPKVVSPKFVF